MTEEDFIGLVDKVICGEITRAERVELEAYLAANGEARRTYDEMIETCELLGKVGDLEPPGDLRKRIMDSVDATVYRAGTQQVRTAGDSGWTGLKNLFRPRLKLALALSIGIILGLLGYSIMGGGGGRPGDVSRLYGTIAGGGAGNPNILSSLVVDAEGTRGTINLFEAGDLLIIAPEFAPGADIDFIIEFDPEAVRFEGFASPDGPGVTLTVDEGYVASHGSGNGHYVISRSDTGRQRDIGTGPANLAIKVARAGRVVYQGEFHLPEKR